MTQAVLDLGDLDDRDLIGRVRAGDASAYAVLYERHREPAMRLARRLTTPDRAQDLVSEAFAKVLDVLGRGLGPQDSFRAYLNTTIRSVHVNGIRSSKRESLTDDYEASGADLAVHDDLEGLADRSAIARAFKGLPERWATVLWLTSVEGYDHQHVGRLMGIEPNAVAALSHRAREGLRQTYLADHLAQATELSCRDTRAAIPAYVRGSLTARKAAKVDAHLDECVRCSMVVIELGEINSNLGALLAPLVLVGGGAVAVSSVGAASVHGLRALLNPGHGLAGLAAGVVLAVTLSGSTPPASEPAIVSTASVVGHSGMLTPDDWESAGPRDRIDNGSSLPLSAPASTDTPGRASSPESAPTATTSPTGAPGGAPGAPAPVESGPAPVPPVGPSPGTTAGTTAPAPILEIDLSATVDADGPTPCAGATAHVSAAPLSAVLPGGVTVATTTCPQP